MTAPCEMQVQIWLHYMPIIVRSDGVTDWERKFCASIISRSRSQKFQPSEKQARIMDRIVREFQARTAEDQEVIE